MASFKSVEELNTHLATRSYVTGYSLSEDDRRSYAALSTFPDSERTPHAYRWALHVQALTGVSLAGAGAKAASAKAPTPAKAPAKAKAAADDDMDFGFDDDEVNEEGETAAEAAATKARHERMEQARRLKEEKDARDNANKEKKQKEKPVEKSLVVLEVKPWEADTDLEMVWREIIKYEQEGLSWGQTFKLEPVAYGIKKLVMTCTIVDALVLMDDVTENIEKLEEYVQSVQVASMNKIS